MSVHPTAIIEPGAKIPPDCEIGPYCYIGPKVSIGPGCRLSRSVVVTGRTTIGARNVFSPFVVIGGDPQDFKYKGEDSETIIGNDNVFRESMTVNKGTAVGGNKTVIGNRNYFMSCSHIAHDTIIEDECIIANQCLLAGHIRIETGVTISGQVGVHHFVTVGRHAFIGGCSRISRDVPPFMIIQGFEGAIRGVNSIGLRRRGVTAEAVNALRDAHRLIWRSELTRDQAFERLRSSYPSISEIRSLLDFLQASDRGRMGRALEAHRPAPLVPTDEETE